MISRFSLIIGGILVLIAAGYWISRARGGETGRSSSSPSHVPLVSSSPATANTPEETPAPYAQPIAEFATRITKKSFGTFVTPTNSPVEPERFRGYHSGVDVEYEDVSDITPVYAITSGEVVYSRYVNGYGGLLIMQATVEGNEVTILYGHLKESSMKKVGDPIEKGEQIGVLGKGYSSETDNERTHLHLAIHKGSNIDLRGYVQNEDELDSWVDPLTLYR